MRAFKYEKLPAYWRGLLLGDPVALVEAGLLSREVDGYQVAYESATRDAHR